MGSDSDFNMLLSATIEHLEGLKRRGHRSVQLDPSVLKALVEAPAARLPAAVAKMGAPTSPRSAGTPQPPPSALAPPRSFGNSALVTSAPLVTDPSMPASGGNAKEIAMEELRRRALACTQCANLAAARKSVVFGVGNIHSPLLFVGEAPGADEDIQGEPFVGAAGQLLTKVIQTMGLSRDSVYIANVLKCRPDTPGQSTGNRKPEPAEMQTCLPYLQEQIRIIAPKVIVALGGTATEGLFGRSPMYITKLRGKWMQYEGIEVMPTYHPSYVLRNQSLATKRETWEDMLAVMERLGMPVSEKQRGYFLK